jgi:ATP-binding cassette subfamily B protein
VRALVGPLAGLTGPTRFYIARALVSLNHVFEMIDWASTTGRSGTLELAEVAGRLELRDVTYTYAAPASLLPPSFRGGGDMAGTTNRAAVKEVSFVVPSGGAVAVVGHSGAGKSTLAQLACGLIGRHQW